MAELSLTSISRRPEGHKASPLGGVVLVKTSLSHNGEGMVVLDGAGLSGWEGAAGTAGALSVSTISCLTSLARGSANRTSLQVLGGPWPLLHPGAHVWGRAAAGALLSPARWPGHALPTGLSLLGPPCLVFAHCAVRSPSPE